MTLLVTKASVEQPGYTGSVNNFTKTIRLVYWGKKSFKQKVGCDTASPRTRGHVATGKILISLRQYCISLAIVYLYM